MRTLSVLASAAMALALAACGGNTAKTDSDTSAVDNPFPSTYRVYPSTATLITNATVIDGTGGRIDRASLLIENGKIAGIGNDLTAPDGAVTIDAEGRWVTPGIIDNHSHLGAYPSPGVSAHGDGNEV